MFEKLIHNNHKYFTCMYVVNQNVEQSVKRHV